MRVVCREKWHSSDPLVEMHLGEIGHWIPWEVEVWQLPRSSMHALYRVQYSADGELIQRTEDFRIYVVERIVKEASPELLSTAVSIASQAASMLLSRILEGDKVILLFTPLGTWLHSDRGEVIDVDVRG